MNDAALIAIAIPLVAVDEGCTLRAIPDALSKGPPWTIGYGHAVNVTPGQQWTQAEADAVLKFDLGSTLARLKVDLPWFAELGMPRQYVLLNMAFNMGVGGLLGFTHTLQAVEDGKYDVASGMMLMSKWASQVGERATRLARVMKTGLLPTAVT